MAESTNNHEAVMADDDDEENFEDAVGVPMTAPMDLDSAIQDTISATNLFMNNKFSEARARFEPWADKSFYHALGYGTIMYLQATMTFDTTDIDNAVAAVKRAVSVCSKFRKKHSILNRGAKNYNKMTREELHAEICYAECLIERALLMFIQDENLISFVKGSLKIRSCYFAYKECLKILQKRNWQPEDNKIHFESGVKLGVGLFNLMISLLPSRVMKLLEFVGFSGKKKKGLQFLEQGSLMETSLRGPLCSLALLGYHTVIVYVLGTADGDIPLAEKVLAPLLQRFPKGALFLFFAGKIEEIKGNIKPAIVHFEESVESQSEWRQFHHLCYWELMWCNSFIGDWLLAMKYAEKLCKESRWSKATYTYQKATFLMMCDDQTEETKAHIAYLFREVPRLKQRIAGKSLPFEKFAVKKAKRFADQKDRLTLPAYELIYVWNGFSIIGKNQKLIAPILAEIERTLKELEANKSIYPYYTDDYCLAMLLKGACLRWLNKLLEAEQCLIHVSSHDKQIKQDNYLIPYAMVELGLLNISKGDYDVATSFLDMAKQSHKYSLESRLHFRIHAAKLELQYKMGLVEDDSSLSDMSTPSSPSNSVSALNAVDRDAKIEEELGDNDEDDNTRL